MITHAQELLFAIEAGQFPAMVRLWVIENMCLHCLRFERHISVDIVLEYSWFKGKECTEVLQAFQSLASFTWHRPERT
jgi:hypothetical protein